MQSNAPTSEPLARWLPDFCSLRVLLALLAVAEVVVLIVVLAPNRDGAPALGRVFVDSVYVQWLALCCALALCRLRAPISRLGVVAGVALAYGCVVAIVALGSALVFWLDTTLGLKLTVPDGTALHFVGGNIAIAALVTAAAFRYFYVRAQWQRGVQAQARAQVAALQARIRPHFLFNSMNTIASLIRSRPDDAERAVEDLGDLFRAALAPGDSPSTLGDELELVQRYLAIEKLRFGERLRLDWQVDAVPRELQVPGLILQPLAENAVLHGIQQMPEGGTIAVRAGTDAGSVRIEVRNPRPREPQRLAGGNRTALSNIRQRLAYHYGDRGRLEVDEGAGYYAVTLTIPRA
jgi:two-component system sensor histidine kinase AlgZ